jgi:hypothetical protein
MLTAVPGLLQAPDKLITNNNNNNNNNNNKANHFIGLLGFFLVGTGFELRSKHCFYQIENVNILEFHYYTLSSGHQNANKGEHRTKKFDWFHGI